MKIKILTLLLCCFSLASVWSQTVSGSIKSTSGFPLVGVNIVSQGTSNGAITNFDGGFEIKAKPGAILNITYVGYRDQNVTVGTSSTLNIVLVEDISELDEVIIVGYGKQKKESVLGAINQVKGKELIETGSANLTNALSGISPGLTVVQSSGQPGGEDGEIFIRGNADPLILVDGVEIVGGFSNINPRDVESVSTLKDGAATAVYGIRGANGVIIITTKRGRTGRPKVSYNSEFSVKSILNQPDNLLDAFSSQSAFNTGILNDEAYASGYSSQEDLAHWRDGDLPYIYPDTDWFDVTTKDYATSLNQTISVTGGTDFVKYYASAGHLTEGDITKTEQFYNYDPQFKFQRYSFRGNLDFTLSETTKLKTSVSSRLEDKTQPGSGTNNIDFLGIYNSAPGGVVPIYRENVLEEYPDELFPGLVENRFGTGRNLFANINNSGIAQTNKTVFSVDLELEQNLGFITQGLTFTGKYNYISTYTTRSRLQFDATEEARLNTFTLDRNGEWQSNEGIEFQEPLAFIIQDESISNNEEIAYQRAQLFYENTFDKHYVTGLALFSRNKRTTNNIFPFFNEDWVGRATYSYDSRYFFEVSGAYNGDETFQEGYRFKFFPSFAAGINLAKESFIKDNIPEMNNFKIRYSYGQTGSKAGLKIANTNPAQFNRWQYLSFYDFYGANDDPNNERRPNSRYYFGEDIDDPLSIITESQIGNPFLTWATVTKQNIGIEYGFFNNKISGEVEFFKDSREDLINVPNASFASFYGFSADIPFINSGASESHGYEVSLTYKNSTSGGFKYSATAFYGYNENRILNSASDGPGSPEHTTVAGKPNKAQALLQTDGYFQNIDEIVNYPTVAGEPGLGDYRYIDYNANGSVIGSELEDQIRFDLPDSPKNSYSLRLNCSFKGWSMSALINGVEGHKGLVNDDLAFALPDGIATGLEEHLDYWTPNNTDAAYPALHAVTNPNSINSSTARVVDLDYIKLRSVNVGYNFDVTDNKTLSEFRIYLNGNNLLSFNNLDYGDPEANKPGDYPILRRINLGINLTF